LAAAEQFLTRTGIPVCIRPIAPADRDALHANFLKLSAESRYRRFLGVLDDLSPAMLTRLTEVDHRNHEALAAFSDGELIGVARFIRRQADDEAAEVAVTIADDWQGQGLGTELLLRLEDRAIAVGVNTFVATCLVDNRGMLNVFRDLPGATCTINAPVGGVVEVLLTLSPDRPRAELARVVRAGANAFSGARHPVP